MPLRYGSSAARIIFNLSKALSNSKGTREKQMYGAPLVSPDRW
jgi:hypothetical protein